MYTRDELHILLREIDSLNTAFFIGAGAAQCSQMPKRCQLPLGNDVKLHLYKFRYGENKSLKMDDYETKFKQDFFARENKPIPEYISPELVWEKCLASSGSELTPYINLLNKLFDENIYISPNYKFLAWSHLLDDSNIKHIVTTNFDEKIESAYRLLQERGIAPRTTVVTAIDEMGFEKLRQNVKHLKVIYKLHGTLSQPFTIRSSASEIENGLSDNKYKFLEDIFRSNGLVVFIGYSCNDEDVFKALMSISKNKFNVKIAWIKRKKPEENSNIKKVLDAFKASERVWLVESDEFFNKLLFETENRDKSYVDRDKINIDVFNEYKKFVCEIAKKDIVEPSFGTKSKNPIHDILYGEISFPKKLEHNVFKIINSFDMQRLRDIKQLSFAQYRYPSATHTRFSHSLGVAYLVSKALEKPNIKRYVNENEDIANTIYAALVHDVGHGPLGHVIDKFYDRLSKRQKHEDFTKKLIEGALIDLRDVLESTFINFGDLKNKIAFKSENIEEIQESGNKLYLMWLLTDYALDLDRIDFLMRDSIMTGYRPNLKLPQELQQTFENQKPCWRNVLNKIIEDYLSKLSIGTLDEIDEALQPRFSSNPETKILYISGKGAYKLEVLLDFLLGLYTEMYINVYYNHTVSSAEAMLAKALHVAYDIGDIDISTLYKFTDSEFYSYLENLESDLIREIVYAVKHRRLFKPIIKLDLNLNESISINEIEKRTMEEFNLDEYDFKSLVVVHLPRRKEKGLKNLFIKKEDRIIPYPNVHKFEEQLSAIKGIMFVHPKNRLFKEKEKLLELMKSIGIHAEIYSKNGHELPERHKTLFIS